MATAEVFPIDGAGEVDAERVGGKAIGLVDMARAGLPVPAGFVVSADAFTRSHGEVVERVLGRVRAEGPGADTEALESLAADARAEMTATPVAAPVAEAVLAAYRELPGDGAEAPVAVRSSALAEDSAEASFAGGHDTYLWVTGADAVIDALGRCWASLFTARALSYRLEHGIDTGWEMAVVVQRMVPARAAGVMMTVNPVTGDRASIVVESVYGLGEGLVSGSVTPDRFVVSKVTGEMLEREVGEKLHEVVRDPETGTGTVMNEIAPERAGEPSVSDDEVAELVEIGRRAERHYGSAQDLEWAIDDGIFVLQCRPDTIWSARPRPGQAEGHAPVGALGRIVSQLGAGQAKSH
jgi:pyruvate, water dikinase